MQLTINMQQFMNRTQSTHIISEQLELEWYFFFCNLGVSVVVVDLHTFVAQPAVNIII
jgi:hypothetical protein